VYFVCCVLWEYNNTVHQLFIDIQKAYDLVRLYNILIEFGVPMEIVSLIKMSLNGAYSKVRIGKHLMVFLSKMV
jgi:hypothetical protein